jgi:predicted RNA-binding Zn-ribbon protein involved in translation (DUF1610 family)
MPRRQKRDPYICPRCGARAEKPVKTWQLISPFPDAKGRITITIMGVFECPQCGYRWRTVVSKIKAGGSSVEVEGAKGRKAIEEEEENRAYVIELDLDELDEED